MELDPEISFKIRSNDEFDKRKDLKEGCLSSDKQIDTSDEMIEVDLGINEHFIADCTAEARRRSGSKRSHADSEDRRLLDEKDECKTGGEVPM